MDAAEHPLPPPTGARTRNQSTRRDPQLWKGILNRGLVDISAQHDDKQTTLLGASSNKHLKRVPGTGRFKKAKRLGNITITGKNDNSPERASDLRIRFLERKVKEWHASTQRERSARQVLEEDILAKVAEIKLLADGALANAQDEERVHRERDVEFSALEGKLIEAITDNKQLKATMASLKRKVHEVQAPAHVAGLKQRRASVELHEELDVAMGQKGSARKERRFAMPKAFTNSTTARVARDISGLLNDCKPLASSVTEGERLQAFVAGRLQKRFGDKGKPPKPRTQPTQLHQRRQQSAQQEQQQQRQQQQPQEISREEADRPSAILQPCCKRVVKRAVEDVEEFWSARKGSNIKSKLRISYKKTQRLIRFTGHEFDADKGPYVPYVLPSCGLPAPQMSSNMSVRQIRKFQEDVEVPVSRLTQSTAKSGVDVLD
jgi:hypothetical protein